MWSKNSAAKGIASRKGVGKVRHIEVHQLWVQDKVASGELMISKVRGDENVADALTKYVERGILEKHMILTGEYIHTHRHSIMPDLS